MSHEPSVWGHPPLKDWGQYLKSLDRYLKGLGKSTGRFGGEESLQSQRCGTWVEATLAQFSRYESEPLCTGCVQAEGSDE